ncbi:MAG: DUF1736 domain-containing protein [Planctomycetes bacterium]|nr:DUF1736 domain-containing protein [Planctomycetota bacterium]MBI3845958.1 DUF1736 domain-containing protein [Planctomycetota bacterium]
MNARRIVGPIAIVFTAVACYANAIGNGFALDDSFIFNNPVGLRLGNLFQLFATPYHFQSVSGLYRPVTLASFAIDHSLFGDGAAGFHATNVLLHAMTSLLVWRLARRFLPDAAALGAALLFAMHPIHTEAVTYVSGRADVLATLFGVAALLVRPIPSAIFFLLAILSKEGAIAILPAMLLLRWLEREERPSMRRLAVGVLPHVLALIVFFVARAAVLGSPIGLDASAIPTLDNATAAAPAAGRIATAFGVFARWAFLLVFPLQLSADYSASQIPVVGFGDALALAGLALVVVGVIAAWGARRRASAVTFGVALLLLAWLPVSNVVLPIGTLMAERLLYLPSVGFCIAVATLFVRHPRVAQALGVVALLLLGVRTIVRNADWKDDLTIYTAASRTTPRAARSHAMLAYSSLDLAKHTTDATLRSEHLARGEREARAAIRLHPEYGRAYLYLGSILAMQGRRSEAAAAFAAADANEVPDRVGLCTSWLALAGDYRKSALESLDAGDRDGAESDAEKAYAIVRRAVASKPDDFLGDELFHLTNVSPEERADRLDAAADAFRKAGLHEAADSLHGAAEALRTAFQ